MLVCNLTSTEEIFALTYSQLHQDAESGWVLETYEQEVNERDESA